MPSARRIIVVAWVLLATLPPVSAQAPIKARVPANITPVWTKGIQPISSESYWNAVECGKQGGASPACVFYDADLCKNEDFVLSLYTPYKMVAYTVWQAVSQKKPPPTPNYAEAQRTRVVLGIKPLRRAANPLAALDIKRGGRVVKAQSQTLDAGGGTFTFDFPVFAPSAGITIEIIGSARAQNCSIDPSVLALLR